MQKDKIVSSLLVLFLSVCLASCDTKTKEPIKIGINSWPGYEFLYLAQELGFYEELGVPVRIIEYASLNDVTRGYKRGKLDAMASTLVEVLQVKNSSTRNPQVILVTDFSNGGDVIIARKPIKTPSDLKGRRVGADTTSLPIFVLARALHLHGVSLDDVTVVPLDLYNIEDMYDKGKIDAAVVYPPASVRLMNRKDSSVIFTSKSIPGEVVDVLSVENAVLQSRPDDINKIRLAWGMALQFTEKNPDKAYRIMSDREGISPREFVDVLGDLQVVSLEDQSKYFSTLKSTLKNVREVLVNTGALSPATSADCCIPETLPDISLQNHR